MTITLCTRVFSPVCFERLLLDCSLNVCELEHENLVFKVLGRGGGVLYVERERVCINAVRRVSLLIVWQKGQEC